MNKYYKAEDIIRKRAEDLADTSYWEYGNPKNVDEWIEVAEMEFKALPTIEVSEEVLKATKNFNAYTIADKNAEMGMRTEIEPIIEVSEDCISREYILGEAFASDEYNRETKSFDLPVVSVRDIENAPSVVPSRAEGEWYRQTTDQFDYWECSECGMGVGLDDVKNYCPNCGAKMRLE